MINDYSPPCTTICVELGTFTLGCNGGEPCKWERDLQAEFFIEGPSGERKKLAKGGLVFVRDPAFQYEPEPGEQIIPMERLSQAFSCTLNVKAIRETAERIKAAFLELDKRLRAVLKGCTPSMRCFVESALLAQASWAGVSPRVIHLAKHGKTARVRGKNFKRAMREMEDLK